MDRHNLCRVRVAKLLNFHWDRDKSFGDICRQNFRRDDVGVIACKAYLQGGSLSAVLHI